MSTSQSDSGLPAGIDHQNKKFTTIIIYPTGKISNEKFKGPNNLKCKYFCRSSDSGEDNHTNGIVYFGFSVVGANGDMLFKT